MVILLNIRYFRAWIFVDMLKCDNKADFTKLDKTLYKTIHRKKRVLLPPIYTTDTVEHHSHQLFRKHSAMLTVIVADTVQHRFPDQPEIPLASSAAALKITASSHSRSRCT